MMTTICILLLVVLAIIIARCNGSSVLGRNLLVSLALGVAVSLGIKAYNTINSSDNKVIAQIENVSGVELPTQFLCTPAEMQVVLNFPGTVSQVLLHNTYATVKENLRHMFNPIVQFDVGTQFWDSS